MNPTSPEQPFDPLDHRTWLEVNTVLQSYADALDRADVPALIALFTPTAKWEYSPGKVHEGHAAIITFFGERLPTFARSSHHVGPPVLSAAQAGGQLRSTAYYIAAHLLTDGSRYTVHGRYVDELTREGGNLLICRRQVIAHLTEGTQRAYNFVERKA